MNEYDASEYGYKNGYEQGIKDFGKFLIDKAENGVIEVWDIPDYVVEMSVNYRSSKKNGGCGR